MYWYRTQEKYCDLVEDEEYFKDENSGLIVFIDDEIRRFSFPTLIFSCGVCLKPICDSEETAIGECACIEFNEDCEDEYRELTIGWRYVSSLPCISSEHKE